MLISVLMPVYNGEEFLCEAIESILSQSYQSFEFIIIDDGSTDGSLEIINSYAKADQRILVMENKRNIGLARSLNKGLEIAQGSYIARQDADDRSAEHRFKAQLAHALSHPEIDLIGSDSFVIDINGEVVCHNQAFSKITDRWKALLERKAIFPHGSAFIKRDKLLEVGGYDERFYYSQDGELWLRLLDAGAKVHTISLPLYYYRATPKQTLKKYDAQAAFHQVKHMMYVKGSSKAEIAARLKDIASGLATTSAQVKITNFMAVYWKSMANTAYFNSARNRLTPYKYLLRSRRADKKAMGILSFSKLALMYLLPPSITNLARR